MSKGRGFRGPRRRGFDDDNFGPPPEAWAGARRSERSTSSSPPPVPEGPPQDATVKWFNPDKGFGFVAMADGSGDVFMHVAVLQAAGRTTVPSGATLRVTVGQGQKGRQVTEVLEVDESTAVQAPPRRPGPRSPREAPDLSTAVELGGVVKWFNVQKGFGFVTADDGDKDVFVHISVVERAGLHDLAEGQRVAMKVVRTAKGREAVSIARAD